MTRTLPLTLALLIAGPAVADPCRAIPDSGPLPAYLAKGSTFSGPVTWINDGDGLCVSLGPDPMQWVEVRLENFYAPESREPGGPEAKAALSQLVRGRRVQCTSWGRKSWDRIIARCRVAGRDLGDLMRASGVREGGRGVR